MPNDLNAKIQKARQSGYTDAQIRTFMQQKGIDTSILDAPSPSPLDRAGEFVINHNLPGSKIGEGIGTAFAAIKHYLTTGDYETARTIALSAPSDKQQIGDAARSAAIPVSIIAPTPATYAGTMAQFAALGAASGAGQAATENANVSAGAVKGAALGAASGLFSKFLDNTISRVGSMVGRTGEKITSSVVRPTKPDLEDGFKIDTIKKYDLGGSLQQMSQKTDALLDDLTAQVEQKYAETGSTINLNDIVERTIEQSKGSKVSTFGSNTSMEGAFEQLKAEVAALSEDGVVNMPEAVQVKRAAGHFGAWLYGSPDPESTARQKVYTAFYRNLKSAIEQNSPPGVKELNQQISDLIPVMNAIIRRIPVAERNNAISLTDIITLTGATIDPRSLSIFLLNQLSKSGKFGRLLMNVAPSIKEGSAAATPLIRAASTVGAEALPQDTRTPPESLKPLTLPSGQPITPETVRKITDATTGLSIEGGAAKLVGSIVKKIQPSEVERVAEFLRRFDTNDLNTQMSLIDNYMPLFKKLGLNDLTPDDLIKVLDAVMARQK